MRGTIFAILVSFLIIISGCQDVADDPETTTVQRAENASTTVETKTSTVIETETATTTRTQIDETRRIHLEEFAREQERVFRQNTNLTEVEVYLESGSSNITSQFGLPDGSRDYREDRFENALNALVQAQYNWVVNGAETYQADYIVVQTDFGEGSASKELLQLYINDKLDRATVAYIWAGEFDPYTELGKVENSSHTTRTERLAYTAEVMKQNMETDKQYVTDVETASEDETIYVKVRQTEDAPNPTWPIEDVAVAYRETVTELGPQYMPSNGVRGYTYNPDNSPGFSFVVRNPWVVSEYVGLFPLGESSLNALNSMEEMDDPHDGPP